MLSQQIQLEYLRILSHDFSTAQHSTAQSGIDLIYLQQLMQHRTSTPALPALDLNRSFHIVRQHEQAPLVIFFQGMYESHITPYFSQHPQLEQLELLNESALPFAFQSFIKRYPEFNYICVKDNFQSWYLLHFEYYLAALLKILEQIPTQNLITVGCSAGGYAAIVYGHYLHAAQTIAFAPQIRAYHLHHVNAYRQRLNERYALGQLAMANLSQLYQHQQGFHQPIQLALASQNESDWIELNFLPWRNDARISTSFFAGREHDLFSFMDKDYLFQWLRLMMRA
ncbi:MAG: hypothetical protein Q4D05_05655 [Acinetobacter sp.]|nr:hypothetical protein [Acinetobacter sp.]